MPMISPVCELPLLDDELLAFELLVVGAAEVAVVVGVLVAEADELTAAASVPYATAAGLRSLPLT